MKLLVNLIGIAVVTLGIGHLLGVVIDGLFGRGSGWFMGFALLVGFIAMWLTVDDAFVQEERRQKELNRPAKGSKVPSIETRIARLEKYRDEMEQALHFYRELAEQPEQKKLNS